MSKESVFEVIVRHIRDVLPDLAGRPLLPSDSLRALGANSVDRADIIMSTLESLSLDVPLVEMARAENIGDLAGIIHAKS